jgi:predicted dehydrogenase
MLNISQIGVGYWGPNLLRNLIANNRCEVKKIAEVSSERRDYVRKLYPALHTTDTADDIFDDSSVDAVIIATPVATHFDLAMRALSSGKHILVEKPLAKSLQEVDLLEREASKGDLLVMAGHTFLFNAAVRYVKKLIDQGDLGDIRYIYSQRLNLGRIRSDVDALWNFAPHDLSIVQYWMNNPKPVSVVKRGVDYIQSGIDDVVFMNIVYPGKVMVNIHVSWLDPRKVRSMTVVGSKKMVVYDDIADDKIAVYDKGIDRKAVLGEHMDYDRPYFQSFTHRSGDILLPKVNFEEPVKVEIDHFIDCIQNGVECIAGLDQARRVVEILAQ